MSAIISHGLEAKVVNRVVLNNQIHRDVRIAATRPTRENAEVNAVTVIPREFPRLLAHYPIFYTKNTETGRFELSALLGFQPQENLFFLNGRWDAAYVPLQIQRQPFSLITRRAEDSDGKPASLEVALDLSQTVQSTEGERLFLEDGQFAVHNCHAVVQHRAIAWPILYELVCTGYQQIAQSNEDRGHRQ